MRLVLVAILALTVVACGDARSDGELLVSAAASLTDAFADVAERFEDANEGVDVVLNLAGSSAIRSQVLEGAPGDVFASADTPNMASVVEAGLTIGDPVIFATNRLLIAVPAGNPAGVEGLGDLAEDDLLVGLCAESVPCGEFARAALSRAGVTPSIDTNEPDVRSLLTKIESGELDVGITYVTDAGASHGAVDGIDIPDEWNVTAEYPIAVLEVADDEEMATAFVEFLLSAEGQEIMAEHGFGRP